MPVLKLFFAVEGMKGILKLDLQSRSFWDESQTEVPVVPHLGSSWASGRGRSRIAIRVHDHDVRAGNDPESILL
jgi:hypothetical protein